MEKPTIEIKNVSKMKNKSILSIVKYNSKIATKLDDIVNIISLFYCDYVLLVAMINLLQIL